MGLSVHTAQASPKASCDTRLHNCVCGVRTIATAIEMVHLEIACCIRPAVRFLHDMASTPTSVLRDWFVAGGTQAVLPSPDTVKLAATSRRVQHLHGSLLAEKLACHASVSTTCGTPLGVVCVRPACRPKIEKPSSATLIIPCRPLRQCRCRSLDQAGEPGPRSTRYLHDLAHREWVMAKPARWITSRAKVAQDWLSTLVHKSAHVSQAYAAMRSNGSDCERNLLRSLARS